MAQSLGISPRTWQDYEGGINVPGWKVLEGLAQMGFNVNWILTEKGEIKITISELESEQHLALRDRLRTIYTRDGYVRLSHELDNQGFTEAKYRRYILGEYVPTNDELTFLCNFAGGWDFELSRLSPDIDEKESEQRRQALERREQNKKLAELKRTGNKIEIGLLKEVTTELEDALSISSIKVDAVKKAELLALIYDEASESEEKREAIKERIQRFLRLVE